MSKILVTGAGGFIGGHLSKRLADDGHEVVGMDIKSPEFRSMEDIGFHQFVTVDMRYQSDVIRAIHSFGPFDEVYALAADMGGMGFISYNDAQILFNNLMINLNTIRSCYDFVVGKYLFTSSACVYPEDLQMVEGEIPALREDQAYPANPQDAYGWEKLTAENLCLTFSQDYGMNVRVVRFHNTYGPYGTWRGGREKAPAALCRKIAISKLRGGDVVCEIWGDGQQVRSYTYVDDTVEGLIRLMASDYQRPINIGTTETMTVNQMAFVIADIADVRNFRIVHVEGPQGVRNRNTDNSLIQSVLGWEPTIPIVVGLQKTYTWIEDQVRQAMERGEIE
jgi:nucleoside-diphosphate-sugar epimerase